MCHQIVQYGLNEQIQYANEVSKASIIPMAYRGKPADIIVAIGFGQSMGLSPAESLYRINVIQGKPTMSAELIAAQVRKAGHKLRISKDEASLSVTATIVRSDDPDYPISVTRDRAWAQQMGLTGKDNYRKQPLTMLTWRAITACAREACPEALFGVAYTPDEMHDMDETPVEAVVEHVEPKSDVLAEVRARFTAFKTATGLDNDEAMTEICAACGADSMPSMTSEQAAQAVSYMDETINAPVYSHDLDF